MKKIYKYLLFVFFYLFSFSNSFSYFGFEKVHKDIINEDKVDFRTTIVDTIVYLLGFTGLIGVAFVIYGGFKILTAGGDDEQVKSGRKVVLYALVGIFVIIIADALISGVYNGLDKNT